MYFIVKHFEKKPFQLSLSASIPEVKTRVLKTPEEVADCFLKSAHGDQFWFSVDEVEDDV